MDCEMLGHSSTRATRLTPGPCGPQRHRLRVRLQYHRRRMASDDPPHFLPVEKQDQVVEEDRRVQAFDRRERTE